MLGKVRPASSSIDCLERPSSKLLKDDSMSIYASSSIDSLERLFPKLLKDDSLSIYEATLMKLKLGSKRVPRTHSEEAVEMETACASEGLTNDFSSDCSCVSNALSFHHAIVLPHEEASLLDSDCSSDHSMGNSKHQHDRNVSILYMFSKFENAQNVLRSSYNDTMTSGSSSSIDVSPISSKYPTHYIMGPESEQECVNFDLVL